MFYKLLWNPFSNSWVVWWIISLWSLNFMQALTSLQTDPSWRKDGYKAEAVKPGALILIEVRTVNHPTTRPDGSKAEGRDKLINVHFNSLDVIANQDTVVELAGFFQRVIPKKTSDERRSNETASFPASLCVPEGKSFFVCKRFSCLICEAIHPIIFTIMIIILIISMIKDVGFINIGSYRLSSMFLKVNIHPVYLIQSIHDLYKHWGFIS